MILRSYLLRKTFFIFSSKKLEVVTIARYLNAFWFFDFSLLDILPKYMNPKLMSRSLYVTDDLPEKSGHTQTNIRTSFFKRSPHNLKALRAITQGRGVAETMLCEFDLDGRDSLKNVLNRQEIERSVCEKKIPTKKSF